ncbi:shr5p [Saccharomyces arboricola H-6]|uniref:Ras modification protein ERF4 n=1 Tax=Saccharomyces arboricola (strain H-6 / AS 2.3317 / CBS 10644) TaxID=1160507 RepID=J8PZI7_SACAR|nr:shr5p [Saccharomyces arboricola H-6]
MCDSHQKEQDQEQELDSTSERALFFNYHEFSYSFYEDLSSANAKPTEHDEDHKLCITHFPNVYAARGSAEFQMTRVVRVPRRFDESRGSLETPQFSTQLPGSEPAAIVVDCDDDGDDGRFVRCGRYDTGGHVFGCSSVSPLSDHLSAAELAGVVRRVNWLLLREEGMVYGWRNLGGVALDALTGGLWSWVLGPLLPGSVFQESLALEQYVAQLNSPGGLLYDRGVRLVLPRRSGCLSLDFVVPRPE